jgi:CDP-paratose 2-epimerase
VKILISGICGFTGSVLSRTLLEDDSTVEIIGLDNFSRAGSYLNRKPLADLGIKVIHADVRQPSDLDSLAAVDWIIDAAANPSVLAGADGLSSSRQLMENNLYGSINLLEYARKSSAGFILISTSRVYSIEALEQIPLAVKNNAFTLDTQKPLTQGLSENGIDESFSTAPPISLYGSSKLCSEALAFEYGQTFDLPVWINRCGVLAGAGQFGKPDQGIFTFWINAYLRRQPLKYIGFGGGGHQVRDCLHPRDLLHVLKAQIAKRDNKECAIYNLSGGVDNSISLYQLSQWCADRFGPHQLQAVSRTRAFDVPWLILDSSLARKTFGWQPSTTLNDIFTEIADHAEKHPDWLEVSLQ